MPNDNKQQNSNTLGQQTNTAMPPVVMEDVVPPMIQMDGQNNTQPTVSNEQPPVVEDIKTETPAENQTVSTPPTITDSGSAAPANDVMDTVMPAVVTSGPKKKFAGGRVIATILGLFLLVGGIGAGVYLTGQDQNIQEKAGSCSSACAPGPGTGPGSAACNACNNANNPTACPCGFNGSGTCRSCPSDNNNPDPAPTITCSAGEKVCNGVCTNTNTNEKCGSCTVGCSQGFACLNGTCVSGEGRSCTSAESCPVGYKCNATTLKCSAESTPTSGTCNTDANCNAGNQCVNGVCINPSLNCKGSDSGAPGCCQVTSDADCKKIGNVVCEPGAQGDRVECQVGEQHCTLRVGTGQCGGNTTTTTNPTPTPPAITAKCQNIAAYSETWTALTTANLSSLKAGDKVNFCVVGSATGGSFTKAKLTINSVAQAETSTKRPSSNDFCQLYTIPAATNTFNVTAQINHSTLGWK